MAGRAFSAEAYAKVNTSLEVLGARPDGFHDIRTVIQPVDLSDTLRFFPAPDGRVSTDSGYGEEDLVVRAVRALWNAGARGGVEVRIEKRIPVGSGLGGGSADAAAALLALNEAWGLGMGPEELSSVGASVGSDVPALVLAHAFRRPVLAEGRGEKVRVAEDGGVPGDAFVVIACPAVASSTAEVYARCIPRRERAVGRVNDLQDAACALHPEISCALDALRAAGAADAMMTGSGSAVFCVVQDGRSACEIASRARAAGLAAFVARPLGPLACKPAASSQGVGMDSPGMV